MTSYATEHTGALEDIREAGAAVTFTLTDPGTYDAATDTWTGGSETTVAGHAIRVKGDPERYRALELIESAAPTLLFAPTTYGDEPPIGSSVTWGGEVFVVRDSLPLEPDGTAILSRVVVSK